MTKRSIFQEKIRAFNPLMFGPRFGDAGQRAVDMGRRFHLTLVISALIGVLTGVAVAGFDAAVEPTLDYVLQRPLLVVALVPPAGLVAVGLLNRFWGDGDTETTDAYVRAYHQRGGRLSLRELWRKVLGSAITLGSGNAMGFEGPAMLVGGTIGSAVEERLTGTLRRDDAKILMVAGAAAGVAAVFKAPFTGVLFAMEVPYRADLARRALLPTLVAAGAAYVTYVAIVGTEPLLSSGGSAPFDLRDLGGGLALGLFCGVLARFGAASISYAKTMSMSRRWRLGMAVLVLVSLAPLATWLFDGAFHLGPSYRAIEWAAHPDRAIVLLVVLFALRALTTWVVVAAGGMGGLFIPLVTQGAIVGSIFQQIVEASNSHLFPIVGIAAFLGAGYRTPLAGVAFVAEATGEPGFLVPALVAAAAAQLTMGRHSFSRYQRTERPPDLEPLTRMAVSEIMTPKVDMVDASMPLDQVVALMLSQNRRWVPVIDDDTYLGLIAVTAISKIPISDWPTITAREIVRTDLIPASLDETVSSVAARLRASDGGAIAVIEDGQVVGVVTLRDLSNVEVLLDRLNNDTR